jgi:PKD repeat protein
VILRPPGGKFLSIAPRMSAPLVSASVFPASPRAAAAAPALAADTFSSGYTAAVERFLTDVDAAGHQLPSPASDNVYSVTAQYGKSSTDNGTPTAMVPQSFATSADAITLGDPFPADASNGNGAGCLAPASVPEPSDPPYTSCLTDAQIRAKLGTVIAAKHLPDDLTAVYYVLLGAGVDVCAGSGPERSGNPCADTDFCSYHSSFTAQGAIAPTVYAVIPWPDVSGCRSEQAPNGSGGSDDPGDDAANVISHEANEAITDPLGTGWYASKGLEVADICARATAAQSTIFGPGLGVPGTEYNQTVNSNHYWLQEEYSLVDAGEPSASRKCEQRPGGEANQQPANVVEPGLLYHGGAVLGAHTAYAVFWDPARTGQNPGAGFVSSTSAAHIGQPVSFTATETTDPQGLALSYSWSFGDGAATTTAQPSASHAYAIAGAHVVTLTVSDADGHWASSSQTITIYRPPTASFIGPAVAARAGSMASFDARASSDPDGTIQRWLWSFGDGATGSGPLVSHVYARPGAYTVTLALTDSNDSSATASQAVQVLPGLAAAIARAGRARLSRGRGSVLLLTGRAVSCPAATLGCSVSAALATRIVVAARNPRRSAAHTIKLATASLSLAPGRRATIAMRLSRTAIELWRRLGRLSCTLTLSTRTGEGLVSSAVAALGVSAPRWLLASARAG